jgi:two-component system sensor histidine kinase UhpB
VVEDNEADFRKVELDLDTHLLGVDTLIHRAETVADAIGKISDCEYDAILLDVRLPDSDGPEGLAAIQKVCPDIPIVMLSNVEDRDFAVEMVKKGAEVFLVKTDVSPKKLLETLQFSLARYWNRKELLAEGAQLSPQQIVAELQEIRRRRKIITDKMPAAPNSGGTN